MHERVEALDAYSIDGESAAVGARALLESIDGSNELELVEEQRQRGRRVGSGARTPSVRNIDQQG